MIKLEIKPERLHELPPCPGCGRVGELYWETWWPCTEYMEGRVKCKCGWFPEDAEAIEVGLGAGEIFMPSSLGDWIKGAKTA